MTQKIKEPSRHLALDGTHNLRDIGGYVTRDGSRVRWRTLFRSDSLHRLTPLGQQVLLAHGLRTVVDLRRNKDLASAPNVFEHTDGVRYLHEPLIDDQVAGGNPPSSLEEMYRSILDRSQEQIASVIGAVALPGALPALVHCVLGKDRTGLVMALLLGIANVPDEIIVMDYELSSRYLIDRMEDMRRNLVSSGLDPVEFEMLLGSPAEAMQVTLEYLNRRYGGVIGFLTTIGVNERTLTDLRSAMLEQED